MSDRFCDIHVHLIPGVDDGAMSLEMAQDMVIQSMLQGGRAIFATPHSSAFLSWPEAVQVNLQAMREMLERYRIKMPVFLGCEVRCSALDMSFLEDLQSGSLPTMNGTRYVLTEFAANIPEDEMRWCVQALVERDFLPIIAHGERYEAMTCPLARELKEQGCTIQINLDSLTDAADSRIREVARSLIREKLVDFLGTDAHNTLDRPPNIRDGLSWLKTELSEDSAYLEAITWGNAQRYLL